jgi:HAMP domain-containing protein
MRLTRIEIMASVATGVLGIGLVMSILMDSWRWSLGLLGALVVLLAAVILLVLRRQDAARSADLERLERKIDNVALRVVTESQATHRELSGLIEQLGADLRDSP